MSRQPFLGDLNAYERWMVESNLEHAKTEGLAKIVQGLHANGYHRVAEVVETLGRENQ